MHLSLSLFSLCLCVCNSFPRSPSVFFSLYLIYTGKKLNKLVENEWIFDCCCSCRRCCRCAAAVVDVNVDVDVFLIISSHFCFRFFVRFDSDDEHMLLIIMYVCSHIIWFPLGLFFTSHILIAMACKSVTNTFHIGCLFFSCMLASSLFLLIVYFFKIKNKFVPLKVHKGVRANKRWHFHLIQELVRYGPY